MRNAAPAENAARRARNGVHSTLHAASDAATLRFVLTDTTFHRPGELGDRLRPERSGSPRRCGGRAPPRARGGGRGVPRFAVEAGPGPRRPVRLSPPPTLP